MSTRSSISAALAGATLTCSCVAAAQTVLEDIVVTAQKREQSLQKVGISVTAVSGEQFDAPGIASAVDVVQQVPALQFSAWTPAFTIFNLGLLGFIEQAYDAPRKAGFALKYSF